MFIALLIICVSVSPLFSARKTRLSDGIKTHDDWIKKLKKTNDARIMYLLLCRAGKDVEFKDAEKCCKVYKNNPEGLDKFLEDANISIDIEASIKKKKVAWDQRYKTQAHYYETPNYHIFGTKNNAKNIKMIGYYMERVHLLYKSKFNTDEKMNGRFIIKIHPTRKDFAEICPKGLPSGAIAYFSGHQRELVGYFDPKGKDKVERLVKVMFHEGFHQFFCYYVPNPPIWLNEGLACYFESIKPAKRLVENKRTIDRDRLYWIKDYVRKGTYTPLKKFIFLSREEFYANAQVNYPQALSVVHFLGFASKDYNKYYKEVIADLKEGSDTKTSLERVFKNVDWDKFEKLWKEYVRKL